MKKKVNYVVLCISIFFVMSSTVFASSNDEAIEVNPGKTRLVFDLFDQRNNLIYLNESGKYSEEMKQIENQLEGLGVESLSTTEVQQKHSDALQVVNSIKTNIKGQSDIITPFVTPPASNNYEWKSYRADWTKNGIDYEVEHLTAVPKVESSKLSGSVRTVITYSNNVGTAADNLIITSAKEASGSLLPGVGILISFYDAVSAFVNDANFKKTTTIKDVKTDYLTTYIQTVDFMYVKKKSQSDNYQVLSYITNDINGNSQATIPSFNYGSDGTVKPANPINIVKTFSYEAKNHRSGTKALAAYLSPYEPRQSLIDTLEIKGLKNQVVDTIATYYPSFPADLK